MKRKDPNTIHSENEDSIRHDFEVSDDFEGLVDNEALISEILTSVILWEVFSVEDSAEEPRERKSNEARISKSR